VVVVDEEEVEGGSVVLVLVDDVDELLGADVVVLLAPLLGRVVVVDPEVLGRVRS
jgi:hypothetical protein